MLKSYLLLIGLCVMLSLQGQQELRFRQFNINHGLAQNSVTCIHCDDFGFLWIGTFDGLCRYDGYEFKTYRAETGNPFALRSSSIQTIFRDMDGKLWIGTLGGGLSSYDRDTDGFLYHELGLSKNNIRAMYQDRDSSLWIGSNNGLVHYDPRSGSRRIFSYESGNPFAPSDNTINAVSSDREGNIWLGTQQDGLNRFDRTTEQFERINSIRKDGRDQLLEEVNQLLFANDSTLLVGTQNHGLLSLNIRSGSFSHLINEENRPVPREELNFTTVEAMGMDHDSTLWVGMLGGGLINFNLQSGKLRTYFHEEGNSFSLSRNAVNALYVDRQANLWVGTIDGGLNFSNHQRKDFNLYVHQPANPLSLSHNSILAILEDRQGQLWVGTDEGGINMKKAGQEGFTRFPSGREDPDATIHHVITSICEDKQGNILLGTPSEGISVYHPETGTFSHYTQENSGLQNNWIFTLMEDSRGRLWAGTNGGGLLHYDRRSGSGQQYMFDNDLIGSISNDYVTCLLETEEGKLWVGTWEGLNLFDIERNNFQRYFYSAENPQSLPNNGITCLHRDAAGNFWVGTFAGLGLYQRGEDAFVRFTERDGLPNNVIAGIQEDDEGKLWISTYKGLSRFNPTDSSFTNFNLGEGLYGTQFTIRASAASSGGDLLFGGINGLYRINPEKLAVDSSRAEVVLTDFKLFNKSVEIGVDSPLKVSIMQTERIKLKHHQHSFSIDFVSANFSVSNQCSYQYILEDFDPAWVEDPPTRTAVYTNVPPGEYTFRIMASNSDGIWSGDATTLDIEIIPAFYQTMGFRILVLAFLILVSASIPLIRYRNVKRQKVHLEKVVHERTREVVRQKEEIEGQAQSLKKANQDIIHKNIELSFQKEEIELQAGHIEEMNRLLQKKADNLVEHLHEISEKRVMQKSVSFEEFSEIYPDDDACYVFLRELKSARPFECHKCHSGEYYPSEGHHFRRCKQCGYREPLTQNTIFYRIKFPILKAFYILYLVSTGRELTIDELSGVVNLRRETCWSFRNKVMEVMKTRKRFRNPREGWKELIMLPKSMQL